MFSSSSKALAVAALLVVSVGGAGCKDKMCEPGSVPEPWKKHESLIPSETVVCGSNRGPKDDYPATHLFVYYKEKNAHEAFMALVDDFEKAGWERTHQHITDGPPLDAIHSVTFAKEGTTIRTSINKNDFGVQGSFELQEPKAKGKAGKKK